MDARDDTRTDLGWPAPDPAPAEDRDNPDPEGLIARGLGAPDARHQPRRPEPTGRDADDTPGRDGG